MAGAGASGMEIQPPIGGSTSTLPTEIYTVKTTVCEVEEHDEEDDETAAPPVDYGAFLEV